MQSNDFGSPPPASRGSDLVSAAQVVKLRGMKTYKIKVGRWVVLEGLVGGNVTIHDEGTSQAVMIERADLDEFIVGLFEGMTEEAAKRILGKLVLEHMVPDLEVIHTELRRHRATVAAHVGRGSSKEDLAAVEAALKTVNQWLPEGVNDDDSDENKSA